ncbi:hypothetical protein LL584_37620, partial [Streptomyces malaysiensis subsp. malaysiensis]|nr:hypothetical protein [Streptomyces malaysiensis]
MAIRSARGFGCGGSGSARLRHEVSPRGGRPPRAAGPLRPAARSVPPYGGGPAAARPGGGDG